MIAHSAHTNFRVKRIYDAPARSPADRLLASEGGWHNPKVIEACQ
jgi:hypothetical protein